ncbi:MAG: DUF2807 domain-containing protein [Pseudomonadota bacterium]
MKPLAYYALAIFFCFLAPIVAAQTPYAPIVSKNVAIGTFSALDVQNPVNVTINATSTTSTPSLQILGDPKSVSSVTWKIKNHTLYLATKWNYWPRQGDRLTVKVNLSSSQLNQIRFTSNGCLIGKGLTGSLALITKGRGCIKLCTDKLNLRSITVDGKTNITLHHIKSTHLVVQGKNDGKIKIEGEVALQTIHLAGNGNLIIYWVNTPYLKINATGTGKIFLAGIAHSLDVQLAQKAYLFSKQLRANNGFVETQNQAQAEISITNRLGALAKDKSTIYYSPHVDFMNTYTENRGLILNTS